MNQNKPKFLCLIGLLVSQTAFSATAIFDDFSNSVSLQKYFRGEATIKLDTTNQNLMISARSNAFTRQGRSHYLTLNNNGTSQLQADLTVSNVTLGNTASQQAMLRIAGAYYNSNSATPTSDVGDVFVTIAVGDRGTGPEAWYEISESTSDDFSTANTTIGSFGSITTGITYSASITYDGNNTFTFIFNNGTAVDVVGPVRKGAANSPFRGVGSRVRFGHDNSTETINDESPDNGSIASIAGSADNVTTESGLQDDFSTSAINQVVWFKDQRSRAITSDGQLRMEAVGQGARKTQRLNIKKQHLKYFGAKVMLSSDSVTNSLTRIRGRLTHYLGNDTYDTDNEVTANGEEGNIWTQLTLERRDDSSFRIFAYASRVSDANFNSDVEIFYQVLNPANPAAYDQQYDFAIEQVGTEVNYLVDGVVLHSVDLSISTTVISGNLYPTVDNPSYTVHSAISARVQDDAGEAHVLFDDITTDYIPAAVTLNAENGQGTDVAFPANVKVHENEVVTLTAVVSDPSTVVAYLWEQLSGADVSAKSVTANKVVGSGSTYSFTVPAGSDTQTLAFKVTVVDDAGVESVQEFDVSVDDSVAATISGDPAVSVDPDPAESSSSGGGLFNPLFLFMIWFIYSGLTRRRY